MKRPGTTLPAFGLLLVLVVCGLGSAAEPAGPKTHVVRIESMKFTPSVISVRPGDRVEFRNTDLVPHTVTERSIRQFDSGMINPEGIWKTLCDREGTLEYRCIYHPLMLGTIIVTTTEKTAARRAAATVELCGAP